MGDTCKTCRFWQPYITHNTESFNGECHIRAPQIVTDADGGAPRTAWPYTVHIDWCGEHQPKDIDKPDD